MKYMGSKSKVAKDIVPIIQRCINEGEFSSYAEPFVGGANVIDKISAGRKFGSDINTYLIELLKYVRDGGELLDTVDRDLYNFTRDIVNNTKRNTIPAWKVGCIGFLASYNGRFFDGGFATPNGGRDYYQEAKGNILKQKPGLQDIEFVSCDYYDLDFYNTFLYLDPPYYGQKQYGSTIFDTEKFWGWVREMCRPSKLNYVIVSEQEAPQDFKCVWEQRVTRTIKAKNKSGAMEKMFIHETQVSPKDIVKRRKWMDIIKFMTERAA